MVRSIKADRRARLLEYSNADWTAVYNDAHAFFQLPHVIKALNDNEYRTREWLQDSANVTHVEELLRTLNQTQKMVDIARGQSGMLPLSLMMEQCNLLLQGKTLQTKSELLFPHFVLEGGQKSAIGIIKMVYAVRVQIFVTYGALQPDASDRLVTETHGLHVIIENPSATIQFPRYNCMTTKDHLRTVYAYGNPAEQTLLDRIKGARFRFLKLCEFCDDTRMLLQPNQMATTLVTEVATQTALVNQGIRPVFFAGQFGVGPVCSYTIDITAKNARQQIQAALPHVYNVIESSVGV